MLNTVDNFLIKRFDRFVQLLEDWFLISQKQIERALLLDFVLVAMLLVYTSFQISGFGGWTLLAMGVVLVSMTFEHRESKARRIQRRFRQRVPRVANFLIVLGIFCRAIYGYHTHPMCPLTVYVCLTPVCLSFRVFMSYVTILDIDGEKRKAAKLSWAKVKELFGTSWVPQPQGAR